MAELEALALGTLLPAFRGTTVPDWVRRAIDRGLTGVTLFGDNVADDDQLTALTADLTSRADILVSLDEEGGDVTRISYWSGSRYPGNAALGRVDDVELTQAVHRAIGADLARLGINLDLAPCGDVNAVDENPTIGTRSFGSDPQLVARHTAAAVRGIQAAGVAACVKHFPGHGATHDDSHHNVPYVDADRELLDARELVPFRAAIDAGVATLMTAHVQAPPLTGNEPATLSPMALTTVLRKELGFEGVCITDALDMKAITDRVGLAAGAVLTLAAGSDLLCLGPLPTREDVEEIVSAIVLAVGDGRLPLSRLEASAARIAELRAWIARASRNAAPAADADGIGLSAARRAVRLSGDISRTREPSASLVLEIDTPATIAVGEVPWGLGGERVDPTGATTPDDVVARADGHRMVIVVRDAHRNAASRAFVEHLLAKRPDATLVEMGLPIWRPECGVYVATYGAASVNAQAARELLGL